VEPVVTAHPAGLVLADHQPVYVTASTQPAAMVRCSCKATVQWCDFATHQVEMLAAAGLLAEAMEAAPADQSWQQRPHFADPRCSCGGPRCGMRYSGMSWTTP
jgi:endonuclease/exonuclease/phosphatase (EEP) superfamily protein YafD